MFITERLVFNELKAEDGTELFPIWSDWDVVKYTYVGRIETMEDCMKRIGNLLGSWKNPRDIGPYVIKNDGKVIGMAGGMHRSEALGEYELYYHFGKENWGKGYAKETARELLRQAFSMETTQRVAAEVVTINDASWMLLEKIGMQREGRLRRKFYNGVEFHDLYVYAMLRDEWEKRLNNG